MTPSHGTEDGSDTLEARAPSAGQRVSSPVATGGAGTAFEQHVGAYWLAQMLVGAIPPILVNATVTEVLFQTERLGWNTDDLLVICAEGEAPRKLAIQVKRRFTVSAANEESVETIGDFWRDFTGVHFSQENDRLVLTTLRGTDTLLQHFVGLLDCARAATDSADFELRVGTQGVISSTATRQLGEIQKIVGVLEDRAISASELWPFLRSLHVLSLDLQTGTSQTEAHIKSMLALTATDGIAASNASWNELVAEASAAMSASRRVRRDNLPAAIRSRHDVIRSADRNVLQTLREHTAPVLRSIRSTIGNSLHLPRTQHIQRVLGQLEAAQVVMVTGPAGSGKSAIGKEAVEMLARDHVMFGFRAEEFGRPHLDATLNAAQVHANWARLRAILGAQDRKIVLVESVERLLEKTERDAFTHLMALAADDPGMRIVLTCRDYSAELVRASFLRQYGIKHSVVQVPPLDDAELAVVATAYPALAIPLKSAPLRDLLRNPFVLDKSLAIAWSDAESLPQTEREFRLVFWREIVRGSNRSVPGIARMRVEALQAIAIRRAQALSEYVPVGGLDPSAVESLWNDSLIASPTEGLHLVATAHDVLEDWSILQWLEVQHLSEAPFKTLSDAVGPYPAVRRSYRKWVAELVTRDLPAGDRLFNAALSEKGISAQFRDDTLVSILRAPSAPDFLARHEGQLLGNGRALLKRAIHLLRVACVRTADWLPGTPRGSIFNVPDGPAWPAVLRLVRRSLPAFTDQDRTLLLALIEDAVRGVSWWAPDLDGAEDVVGIGHWLLPRFGGYRDDDARTRVLKVIAKLPKADIPRFEATLRGPAGETERDDIAEEFQKLIFNGTEGMAVARDLPDLVTSVGAQYLLASETDIPEEVPFGPSTLDVDLYFGIKQGLRHDSSPASAFRGPWGILLRHHTAKALKFYFQVFEHTADWYAHPRLPNRLEPPMEVELVLSDGNVRKQWTNDRLWRLYRGTSVGPYPLESMLMALESWLIELGKRQPEQLDAILMAILWGSSNAALAGVVASVATAYPRAATEALLSSLSVREYIVADFARRTQERMLTSSFGMFPAMRVEDRVYEEERKTAAGLPHRKACLEDAIRTLQLGPAASRVHAVLDKHLARLAPKEQQGEDDRLWRLAIHRMDLRQYTANDVAVPEESRQKREGEGSSASYVVLELKPPDADVQALVDEGASRMANLNSRIGLLMWAHATYKRDSSNYDPVEWKAKLIEAREVPIDDDDGLGYRNAPGIIAAVCARDRWEDMTPSEREWCVDRIFAEVFRHADDTGRMERRQRNAMEADRPCAAVLPGLLQKPLDPARADLVRAAFAAALTHPVEEVQERLTMSIDESIWASNRPLALRCLNAIATEAASFVSVLEAEAEKPYEERTDIYGDLRAASVRIRERFWEENAFPPDAHAKMDVSTPFGAEAFKRILVMLGRIPKDPLAIAAYTRANRLLSDWWTSEDEPHASHRRDHHLESEVIGRVREFLLRTTPAVARGMLAPLLETIDDHSREIARLLEGITVLQDRDPHTEQYWFIWTEIAVAVKTADWIKHLDEDRPWHGAELLSTVFLTTNWKDDVRHWRYLEGYAHLVDDLFEALPRLAAVFEDYTRFLYEIGERSLPEAFVRLASALEAGNAEKMLRKSNTVFLLEVLLQRFVYGRPVQLKSDPRMRKAVLTLLDSLVEAGSSAAFRMRDDFVTPPS